MRISAEVAKSFEEIQTKIRRLDSLVAEIATASQEQSSGIAQVTTAVTQMDKVTQSNAGNAEETAAAAEELNAQSQVLKESVGSLQALVGNVAQAAQPTETRKSSNPRIQTVTSSKTSLVKRSVLRPAAPAATAHADMHFV